MSPTALPSWHRVPGAMRPASTAMAKLAHRIRLHDIELAYRITGRGKSVILVHNDRGDTAGHITASGDQVIPGFRCFPSVIGRH